ncbi:MAG: hypothetical protein GABNV1_gp3 [Guiyang argiope bruennichi nora-like virus 1]|nr:MAG: hypothetical protein GABNV1_gp3 [Guiyang argiope bruennichi nora-like virus 1]
MALKAEIFDQNTTLFSVLDENEVTEIGKISLRVDRLNNDLAAVKLQLDGLALVVDQNQARNEEQFVRLNTNIVSLQTGIDNLNDMVTNLENSFTELSSLVSQFKDEMIQELSEITNRIDKQNTVITNHTTLINRNTTRIYEQQLQIDSNSKAIESLNKNNKVVLDRLASIESRLEVVEKRSTVGGIIMPNQWITIWNFGSGQRYEVKFNSAEPLILGSQYYSEFVGNIAGYRTWSLVPSISWEKPASIKPYAITGNFYYFWRTDGKDTWLSLCYVF